MKENEETNVVVIYKETVSPEDWDNYLEEMDYLGNVNYSGVKYPSQDIKKYKWWQRIIIWLKN